MLDRRQLPYASNKYPIGVMNEFTTAHHILDIGEENRHYGEKSPWGFGYGHVMFLNIRNLVQPVSRGHTLAGQFAPDYPPLCFCCDETREQGGIVIWCHNGRGMEAPVSAALGKLDAFNLFDPFWMDPEYDLWYMLLNCGIHLPASTGTDWFVCSNNRVYVQTEEEFSYQSWIEGMKSGCTFITNGPEGHVFLVYAKTGEKLSAFLVDRDCPGFSSSHHIPKMGMRGSSMSELVFDECRVPGDNLLGEEGGGWQVAMKTLTYERAVTGGQAGGVASMTVSASEVVELARNAMRGGRLAIEDPLVRDQLVSFLMEEKGMDLNNKRAKIPALISVWRASIAMSRKLTGTEWRRRLNQFAVTLQGANASLCMGDTKAVDRGRWQRGYFQAFSGTIGGGTSQIQKNIVGERVLGLPKQD